MGGTEIGPGGRACQPGGAGVAGAGRVGGISGLALNIGFDLAQLGALIIGSRHGSPVDLVSRITIPPQAVGHDTPALGVVEDASVLLDARIENHRPHDIHLGLDERRSAKHLPIGCVQPLVDGLHATGGLFFRGCPADDRPKLCVQVNLAFFIFMRAVYRAILRDGPDKPVAVPGAGLDAGIQLFALGQRPGGFF